MRIYIDAMGGDFAPVSTVGGAIEALSRYKNIEITLGGQKEEIEKELNTHSYNTNLIHIDECSENISNHESPTMAIRKKKDSAIVKAMLMLQKGEIDAFVSSGSTGALLAGGMFKLGRIKGIDRPAIATLIPHAHGQFLLLDSGANVDCQARYLLQFAHMGSAYMQGVLGIENPRVGLINIGAEEEKGDALRKEVFPMLAKSSLNFIGNVEARDIPSGVADVLICDGFVGNIILKYTEGLGKTLMGMLKSEIMADKRSTIGAVLAKPAFRRFKKSMDYSEIGGAPLLGVNGIIVKAHGSSNGHAICSAIGQAIKMIEANLVNSTIESLENKNK